MVSSFASARPTEGSAAKQSVVARIKIQLTQITQDWSGLVANLARRSSDLVAVALDDVKLGDARAYTLW